MEKEYLGQIKDDIYLNKTNSNTFTVTKGTGSGAEVLETVKGPKQKNYDNLPTMSRRAFMGGGLVALAGAYTALAYKPMAELGKFVDGSMDLGNEAVEFTEDAFDNLVGKLDLESKLSSLENQNEISQKLIDKFKIVYSEQKEISALYDEVGTTFIDRYESMNKKINDTLNEKLGVKKDNWYFNLRKNIHSAFHKVVHGYDPNTPENVGCADPTYGRDLRPRSSG